MKQTPPPCPKCRSTRVTAMESPAQPTSGPLLADTKVTESPVWLCWECKHQWTAEAWSNQ
ncbi:hypothetical protein [Nitrospira sp. BLG_2]|uniref:hypothetical protein n=1 Tax=Nitrospira sp. BLG_2 TaxID=3397507 RepID=UPI003B9C81D9